MLQNTDKSGNEDDWAQHFQEEECRAFVVHAAEDKVCPFISESEEFFKHLGEASHEAQTDIRVQEEPCQ